MQTIFKTIKLSNELLFYTSNCTLANIYTTVQKEDEEEEEAQNKLFQIHRKCIQGTVD